MTTVAVAGWRRLGPAGLDRSRPHRAVVDGAAYAIVHLDGEWRVFSDACPHRMARLSSGRIVGDRLECPYHGWRFDGSGRCTLVPSLGPNVAIPTRAATPQAGVAVERDGSLWAEFG